MQGPVGNPGPKVTELSLSAQWYALVHDSCVSVNLSPFGVFSGRIWRPRDSGPNGETWYTGKSPQSCYQCD